MNSNKNIFTHTIKTISTLFLASLILIQTGCSNHVLDMTEQSGTTGGTPDSTQSTTDIKLKSGNTINEMLKNNLGAASTALKFIPSTTPPTEGIEKLTLTQDSSKKIIYTWLDGTTIYYFSEGYTDSGNRIPLKNNDIWGMFWGCSSLKEINLSMLDTAGVRSMGYLFADCNSLANLNLNGFNTTSAYSLEGLFMGCSNLSSIDLSNFDTTNVKTMMYLFYGCSSLTTLDLSNYDTSKVTNMYGMFLDCSNLTTIKVSDSFVTANVTSSDNMFTSCSNLKGGNGTLFDFSNPEDCTYARIDTPSTPGYFTRKQ